MIVEGESVILTATFSDEHGNATDPTTPVTVTVTLPDGTKDTEAEATKDDTGVFSYQYTTTTPGTTYYKFESADGGIEQDTFYVYKDNTA